MDNTAYSDCVYQLVLTNACTMTSPAASGGNCAVAAKREDKMLISSLDYQCTGGNHDSVVRIFVHVPFLNTVHVRFAEMFTLRGTTAHYNYNSGDLWSVVTLGLLRYQRLIA